MQKLVLAALLLSAFALVAQENRGTLTGVITDASGAVVPNVSVRITNTATNRGFTTQSTSTRVHI